MIIMYLLFSLVTVITVFTLLKGLQFRASQNNCSRNRTGH